MRKEGSTNSINEKRMIAHCGLGYTLSVLSGRWKMQIFWTISKQKIRYSDLRELLPHVSERMLVMQLKEMEKESLIKRIVYAEVPPRVEYEITENGLSLVPIVQILSDWGTVQKEQLGL
jgi:DNA-binding HxlR family transcriptional regulator